VIRLDVYTSVLNSISDFDLIELKELPVDDIFCKTFPEDSDVRA
jgi:hypothetical protein